MKLTARLVVAVCVCLLAPLAGAQTGLLRSTPRYRSGSEEATARLTRQIDPLAAVFQPGGLNGQTGTFLDSMDQRDTRAQLFRLESLLRLYRHKFGSLNPHLRQVKEVEDGLGAYAYAVDSVAFAKDKFKADNQAHPADATRLAEQRQVLEGLGEKEAAARGVLSKLLEHSTLGADLGPLRSLVDTKLRGWGYAQDIPYVKREFQQMLGHVRNGRFDFTKLEDGIHEFRRQLRWFPITVDALDGLVLVRDDPPGKCPIPALESLAGSPAAKNRYSNPALHFPASHACRISRCLLWQVVKTVRDLGRLKDEAQGNLAVEAALDFDDDDVATSNKTTPEETARAEAMRTELFKSRALESLTAQLGSCKP